MLGMTAAQEGGPVAVVIKAEAGEGPIHRPSTRYVCGGGLPYCFMADPFKKGRRCFRHQLLLPHPYLVLTKPLRLDIQCQRGASVKIGWKYLDD